MCQEKRSEIVDREPELMTVATDLSSTTWRAETNPGVVDQDVQTIVRGRDVVREAAHLLEGREIGAIELDL